MFIVCLGSFDQCRLMKALEKYLQGKCWSVSAMNTIKPATVPASVTSNSTISITTVFLAFLLLSYYYYFSVLVLLLVLQC